MSEARPVRCSILMVDDHQVVRAGYARYLEADPSLQVDHEAASAAQAYALLQDAEARGALPQLMVVDISLGERSGLELIERCARRFPALRQLVFSMHEDPLLVEHALQAGALGYVSKSSPPQTILEAVRALRMGRRFVDPALKQRLDETRSRARVLDQLTRRELEILSRLVQGMDPEALAQALSLSPKTVANHLSSIRSKLGAANDFQLVRLAAALQLPPL